jgi:Mrp family chromosome partitioning ATPase
LDNRCSLAEGIYRDPERDIDVLLLSRNTANVKIIASQFVKLLTDVRQDYDLILVDAAPVLASDKTEIALMQADVSIILIQGDRSSYRDLRLCFETFARLRVPAMAAVLNWGAPRHRSKVWVLLSKFLEPLRSRLRKKQTPPSPDEWQSALQASKEPP